MKTTCKNLGEKGRQSSDHLPSLYYLVMTIGSEALDFLGSVTDTSSFLEFTLDILQSEHSTQYPPS